MLHGRRPPSRSGVRVDGALAARARVHRAHRYGGRAGEPGCARRVDGRGSRRRRAQGDVTSAGTDESTEVPLKRPDGSPFYVAEPLPLPVDRVRFVGEAVAMVVAETALAARDGAERVIVDWTVGVDRLEEDRAARGTSMTSPRRRCGRASCSSAIAGSRSSRWSAASRCWPTISGRTRSCGPPTIRTRTASSRARRRSSASGSGSCPPRRSTRCSPAAPSASTA
jgi:hypothetical protein